MGQEKAGLVDSALPDPEFPCWAKRPDKEALDSIATQGCPFVGLFPLQRVPHMFPSPKEALVVDR